MIKNLFIFSLLVSLSLKGIAATGGPTESQELFLEMWKDIRLERIEAELKTVDNEFTQGLEKSFKRTIFAPENAKGRKLEDLSDSFLRLLANADEESFKYHFLKALQDFETYSPDRNILSIDRHNPQHGKAVLFLYPDVTDGGVTTVTTYFMFYELLGRLDNRINGVVKDEFNSRLVPSLRGLKEYMKTFYKEKKLTFSHTKPAIK